MNAIRLDDGTEVFVRPIRATDKARLAAGLTRLSETSRQQRFLGPKPRLTTAELRYLTEVDGHDHYAVVAVDPHTNDLVASARWVRLPSDPQAAEAAVVVCDELQGKGLGKNVARMLADAARGGGGQGARQAAVSHARGRARRRGHPAHPRDVALRQPARARADARDRGAPERR